MFFNSDLFLREAEKMNIPVQPRQTERFEIYARMLAEKNKVMNVTAVTDPDGIAVKHFADSISILTAADIPQGARVIDVGTGGGFPGIPLLIMRPGINLTLLDSTAKKIDFVSEVVSSLGLTAEAVSARAEELAKEPGHREKYDFCVSRAVASLNVLSELCLPFLRTGGIFISMKGAKASEELDAAEGALKALGAETEKTLDVKLGDGFERKLIVIRKTGETDSKFPRQYGQILKRPL